MPYLQTCLVLFLATCLCIQVQGQECTQDACVQPDCRCLNTTPPVPVGSVPQLVMLTFDDAVTVSNYPTYKKLLMSGRKNAGNRCAIKATFFVTHDYTNYHLVNQLYRYGNEIAVHSISHVTDTDLWKKGNYTMWSRELGGMRTVASTLAKIPPTEIQGVRVPFLQTSGNATFSAIQDLNFTYDSSMPTLRYINPPIWPYTLDRGYQQDCQIQPCPTAKFPGLWLIPMVNYKRVHHSCAMADACVPYPETQDETFEYFRENFERHYNTSRAPFPVYLHHAWLQHESRMNGYFQFVDWLLSKDDVYLVSSNQVIEYMKNPVNKTEYDQRGCGPKVPQPNRCKSPGTSCFYENVPPGGTRYMVVCDECPAKYPWVDNPQGR